MKILIIENEPLKIMGLNSILQEVTPSPQSTVLDQFENGEAFLEKNKIILLILGTNFSTKYYLPKINAMSKTYPEMYILSIIEDHKKDHLVSYLRAGIHGILSPRAPIEEFKLAVKMILNNKKYVSDDFREVMMQSLLKASGFKTDKPKELSKREKQVMDLLVAKIPYPQISEQLNIKETTIVTYKNRILSKLNISSFEEVRRDT